MQAYNMFGFAFRVQFDMPDLLIKQLKHTSSSVLPEQ